MGMILKSWAFVLVLATCGGCTTRSKADAEARGAYLAGQHDAMMQAQQQARGPGVTFTGPVKKPFVAWSDGLTLAAAILSTEYYGVADPRSIVIRRNGQQIRIDPKRLLRGEDFPLEPGDEVDIR